MAVAQKEDVVLLADEKFDFDLSLSSSSTNEDDEVFFGPVGHKEKCIAASLNNHSASPDAWSPLTGEKFVEVYKEAHLLALQIESHSRREAAQAARPVDCWSQGVERFVQESKLKISLFEKEQKIEKNPTPLKRETFCLSESSLMESPLLGVQPPLGASPFLALSPAQPSTSAPAQTTQRPPCSSQPLSGQPGTSHPPNQAGPLKRVNSKLQPPRALAARGKHPAPSMDKPKKEAPTSLPRTKLLSEKESHRDVLPDKASVAASLPASTHPGPGKRSLPVPNKLGPKKTLLKPPGYTGSLMKKPSSSVSALSLNSSMRTSPGAGKAKSSDLASIPANSSRPLTSLSKLGRMGSTMLRQSLPAAPAGASCRQTRRISAAQPTAEQPKAPTTAPLAQPKTPQRGDPRQDPNSISSASSQLNKTTSIKRRDSYLNSKTKVVSTPTNPFKVPQFSIGESPDGATPTFSRAQQLQSWGSASRAVHSTPIRHLSAPTSQGLPGSMRTPMSTRRVPALSTPASRRISGLPLMTPQSMPRPLASPLCVPARRLSSSEPGKRSAMRAKPTQESDRSTGHKQVGQSVSPEESSSPLLVPQELHFSLEKRDFALSQDSTRVAAQDRAEPCEDTCPNEGLLDVRLDQLTITPEVPGQAQADRPLIAITPEVPGQAQADRPLITITPEVPGQAQADRPLITITPEVPGQAQADRPLITITPEVPGQAQADRPLITITPEVPGQAQADHPLTAITPEVPGQAQADHPLTAITPEVPGQALADCPLIDFGSTPEVPGQAQADHPLITITPEVPGQAQADRPLITITPEVPGQAMADRPLIAITPEVPGQALADCPLIDFGSTPEANMASRPSSQPLIDLMMNTPDMNKSVGKPVQAKLRQLIDLGSPLIQLSPEADKENMDSPLLKF